MTLHVHQGGADDGAEAAAWVVRLSAAEADFAEFEAFETWLAAAPGRAQAYDQALAAWQALPVVGAAAVEADRPIVASLPLRRTKRPWAWPAAATGAVAAAAALWLIVPSNPAQTYETTSGERRTVALTDGSHVALNADTQIAVKLSHGRRDVALVRGEAAFDVARDVARPFVVRAGERSVRVLGTEFDVRREGEAVTVSVRRGLVEVRAADSAPPTQLHRGDQLALAGSGASPSVRRVDPDTAFAWREDRLVYRDSTLGEVVEALNVRFGPPSVTVDEAAARLPFSGVLVLDSREQAVRRLTLAEPIMARPTRTGIQLTVDPKSRH